MGQHIELVFLRRYELFLVWGIDHLLLQSTLRFKCYVRGIDDSFHDSQHVVFSDAQFLPFATNHRFISFMLYTIGMWQR